MVGQDGGSDIPSPREREQRREENLQRWRYNGPVMGCICPPGAEKTC